jgi:FkbM family methyltransferase
MRNHPVRARVYWARRLIQTPRTFSNWTAIMREMWLGRAGRGPAELTFLTRSGMRITTPNVPGARVPVYEIFAEDCYRLEWLLGPLLDRPIQVVDIGGHVGTFACRLTQLHPKASVMSFEPSATTAAYLRRNAEQNGAGDRVMVFERALAATSGRAAFIDNGGGSGLNGLAAAGHASGPATEVDTIAFDDAVRMAPAPVDVVKIDCEGGEYELVLGSSPSSWETVQRLVIEFHPVDGHGWPELRDYFAGVGLVEQDKVTWEGYGCVWLSREPLPARSRRHV